MRCVVLSGIGANFCSGIDLDDFGELLGDAHGLRADAAVRARHLAGVIAELQRFASAPAACRVPVVAVVWGECIGAGLDLLTACDVRVAAAGAGIQAAEPHLGFAADLGTVQRLSSLVGSASWARAFLLSAARARAEDTCGLFSSVEADAPAALAAADALACRIAALPPAAVEDTKALLRFADGSRAADGLALVAALNAAALQGAGLAARAARRA